MSNRHRTNEELAINTVVGQNLKYLRKVHNLNQTKVGNAIGVTFQQIQKYEKGMNGLSALRLKQLADKFKVSLDVLIDPQMIIKHRGFTGLTPQDAGYLKPQKDIGSLEEIKEDKDWIVANNLTPKILVGSLKEIKDELVKDGLDPEETILPTLRNAAKKELN